MKKGQEVLSFQRERDDRGLEEKPRGADVTLHTLSWLRLGLKKNLEALRFQRERARGASTNRC